MGKGDKKSKKGKRFKHSYGKTRLRKRRKNFVAVRKIEDKPKIFEQKKPFKPEPEFEKPVVVETKTEEIKIEEPVVVEIKEEIPAPVVESHEPVKQPEVIVEVKEEKKKPETKKTVEAKKPAVKEDTKKRGRPKKK